MKADLFEKQDLARAFSTTPPLFVEGMNQTLCSLETTEGAPVIKKKVSAALVIAVLILVLLMGVVGAMSLSPTADVFGWFYGQEARATLLAGNSDMVGQTVTLGDVTYTIDDLVYKNGIIYGSATIEAGAYIVLIPEDTAASDPVGYSVFDANTVPASTKTYADLARERNARIVAARLVPSTVWMDDGIAFGHVGYFWRIGEGNTIQYAFEVRAEEGGIPEAAGYQLDIHISNWEVTPADDELPEEPQNTWLRDYWTVILKF